MRTAISPIADIRPIGSPEYTVTNAGATCDGNDSRSGLGSTPSGPIRAPAPSPDRIRILLLAANPLSTERLAIDEEARAIALGIRLSDHRDRFEFIPHLAVQPDDLFRLVSEHRPHILHFSGHGASTGEILLSAGDGTGQPVGVEALARFFRVMRKDIRVVLLNACYTAAQARAIGRHIDFVIGTHASISDKAARVFAAQFYSALGNGSTVQEAFDRANTAPDLHGLPGHGDPQLVTRTGADIHLLSYHQPPDQAPRRLPWPKIWALTSIAVALSMVVTFGTIFAMAGVLGGSRSLSPSTATTSPTAAEVISLIMPGKTPGDEPKFDVFQKYNPRGFLGDVGDIVKEQVPTERLTRMTYTAGGEEPHECDYKFVNGSLNPAPCKFAGILFLDGDWGRESGRGYDLRGRRTVTWKARSITGNVAVEFFAGGVNWVWDEQSHTKTKAPYPDSMRRETLVHAELTPKWQTFSWTITSTDEDLKAVIGPFGWIITWDSNGVTPSQTKTFTVEIRDVTYEK